MGANYLKKYYLDDAKLAQRARLEFFRALSTGRMISFVGSMATQAFGYGSWDQLRLTFSALAGDAARALPDARMLQNVVKFEQRSARGRWTAQIGMSLIEEALDQPSAKLRRDWRANLDTADRQSGSTDWPLDRFDTPREWVRLEFARRFRAPRDGWRIDRPKVGVKDGFDAFNVPVALWHQLGLRRFATANYDFELERVSMLSSCKRKESPFETLVAMRDEASANLSWDLGSGRIRRTYADGWAIESDLLNRERIDRMIEFAVGTDDVDAHIMHLHGRACDWRSIIASQRDYDRLYRREDLNRRPFEFAKRLMMGGNPILFVGLGMSEAELNQDMQEFISNNPYQRVAPTFLLWSARAAGLTEEAIAAKRVEIFRKLGVLTIFDTDLGAKPTASDTSPGAPKTRPAGYVELSDRSKDLNDYIAGRTSQDFMRAKALDARSHFDVIDRSSRHDLKDLKACVDLLATGLGDDPNALINPVRREVHIGKYWRSMKPRIQKAVTDGKPVVLWDITRKKIGSVSRRLVEDAEEFRMLCVIGPQGCGKGGMARALANSWTQLGLAKASHCLLINGGFSFDTDTLLDGVARFFAEAFQRKLDGPNGQPLGSRREFFASLNLNEPADKQPPGAPRVVVIINGMERFFDTSGQPLSAELDQLLNAASRPPTPEEGKEPADTSRVRWVMFGTDRVKSYMDELRVRTEDFRKFDAAPKDEVPGRYLNSVWKTIEERADARMSAPLRAEIARYEANRAGRISGDSIEVRRALFSKLFEDEILAKVLGPASGSKGVDTARQILKALAFIGLPVEEDVLALMPGVGDGANFAATLRRLTRAGLVFSFEPYASGEPIASPPLRYALHRSLLTELRYRYGIPLSEAKLSTAFNMSLYVAQPIDGDIPDTDIHDELGDAIDRLIGSYHIDDSDGTALPATARKLKRSPASYSKWLGDIAKACGASRSEPKADVCREIHRLCGSRHVRALRTALALVRSYYSTTGLLTLDSGDRLIREGRDGVLLEHAERLDDLIDGYGKATMAREAMRRKLSAAFGDEGKAGDAFAAAFGTAEPFYPDELVWLHNERGVVRLAMGDLYEARRSFDQAQMVNRMWVEREDRAHNWRRIRLNQLTVDLEMGNIGVAERKCEELIEVSKKDVALREGKLATAIATGYQAWCLHLRGRIGPALECYRTACDSLAGLPEVRAQAYFERLRSHAHGMAGRADEHQSALRRALHLAQASVQMDLVHRLQITLADICLSNPGTTSGNRDRSQRHLEDALTYALHTDIPRVRCEASASIARARLDLSDFDGALRYATDAMMVATRYGLELRKIALRASIAKIMAARGHPVTAEQLARTCIKMATRQRYQTAIDRATQVILDIPRISAAISSSDKSGRRTF